MSNKQVVNTLHGLHRICKAGEHGFRTVAENVNNRALKVLLKTYAEERRLMAEELVAEIKLLGNGVRKDSMYRGIIHRGRIAIMAALTIRRNRVENVVLREASVGERVALRAYEKALTTNLPAESEALVKKQMAQVQSASEHIAHLRGRDNERLIVRLYDTDQDLERALQVLHNADFADSNIEVVDLEDMSEVYEGPSTSITEAVISGAVGGAIWGIVLGAIIGAGSFVPNLELMSGTTPFAIWLAVTLAGFASGALIGGVLGGFIGMGIAEADAHLYEDSIKNGNHIVMVHTSSQRAPEASNIMHKVNANIRSERKGRNVTIAAA